MLLRELLGDLRPPVFKLEICVGYLENLATPLLQPIIIDSASAHLMTPNMISNKLSFMAAIEFRGLTLL